MRAKIMRLFMYRYFSTAIDSVLTTNTISARTNVCFSRKNPIPIPNRTIPEPKGQDFDFVSVAYSHLIHSEWDKLNLFSTHLSSFRVKHVLLEIRKDPVLSLEFYNWVKTQNPKLLTLETHCMVLHVLAKYRKFTSAETVLRAVLGVNEGDVDFPSRFFEGLVYSYKMCDSSPRVFDVLFKTYAHLKKFRNASDAFCWMKDYGFLPTVESCNKYLSSLLSLQRADIALVFHKEMRRCRITPNVFTLNMVMCCFCEFGKLEKAIEVFREMESMGISPNVASYNTLISGFCNKGLLSLALKYKNLMSKDGLEPNVVTFNTLIHGFCNEGKVDEAGKAFSEMKAKNVSPNVVTYNTLIKGYSQAGNTGMGSKLHEEMRRDGVEADILTYNALITGLCKAGKTKKAAYFVKELDKEKLIPNASTFTALINGQCVRKNPDRAFELFKSMVRSGYTPNAETFELLLSCFQENGDFEGAFQVLMEMCKRCFVPDSEIVLEVYNGLCQSGQDHLAMKLCREIREREIILEASDEAGCSVPV